LIGPLIAGIFNPVLDYDVTEKIQNHTLYGLEVKITNYGLVSAKNIQVYFNAPGIDFGTFGSMPLVNGTKYYSSNILKIGNALYLIPALTPRSETTVTANIKNVSEDSSVIVYLRSETSTGVHNLISLVKVYIVYAAALAFNVLYIIYWEWNLHDIVNLHNQKLWRSKKFWIWVVVNVVAIAVIFCFLYFGACEGKGNCLSYGIYS
jgi:hypothetical protein